MKRKKQHFKRTLACLLVVIMTLSAVPISGFFNVSRSIFFVTKASAYSAGDYVQYGNYPQSRVTDSSTLTLLDNKIKRWKSYNYYSGDGIWNNGKMTPSNYMYYADIDTNGDGLRDYRAVRFDKYRPNLTGYTSSALYDTYQDDNGYSPDTIYYFTYEPILWRILDPSSGLIMTEKIMDSQAYNNFMLYNCGEYYGDSAKTYYASDYYNSSIRRWLNNDFYDTAFTDSQALNIRNDITLNNDCPNISYPEYNSKSSKDKIFLLSYDEVKNNTYGLDTLSTRVAQGTDYAKCQGLNVGTGSFTNNSFWLLRTPEASSEAVRCVYCDASFVSTSANSTCSGIRPACRLTNLKTDISKSKMDEDEYENGTSERIYILGKGLTSYKAKNHLDYGEAYQLEAYYFPSMEQITESLTWYSSDSSVISVNSSGLITGHKKGYAYIYAKTASGLLSRHGYFVYVGDYKVTGSEPDEFIYFAQNNNLSVADAAYVDLHLNFINSRKYEDRMNNRWGKYLGEEIIEDKVGTVAEFFYQVVNTATEIAECKTLSQFENPYIVILADFMMSQSIGDARVSSAYEVYGTNEMKAFKVLKKYFQTSDAWVSEWNSSTDIKKIIQAVKKDYSSTGLYNVLQNALGDIISETGLNDLLASVDMLDGLMQLMSNFGDVVDWFYNCYNFTLSVSSYIETSDEFRDVLRNVGKAAEQNEGTYYKQLSKAINSYISVLNPDDIANAMLKKFASEGAKTLYNMVADDVVDSVKAWVTKKAGLSNALVAKLSQAEFWATLSLNTGWKIGNWATGNDGAVAARELIRANHFFEHLLFLELKNRETDLRSKQTYTAALYFDEAFQMLKCSELYALEQSQNYIDSVDNLWNYIIHGFSAEKYADQRSFSVAQISAWKLVNCHTNSQINDYLDRYQYYSKQKVVRVACPTDVEVKNSDGEVVLRIENNEIVFCADDITASVDGDIKYFSVTNANDYYISIVATDNGSMDYKVDEYTDLGEYLGSYTNEKISIVKDETFKGIINNEENDADYTLTNSNGVSLSPQFYDDSSKVDVASIETTSEKTMKYGDEEFLNYVVLPEKASTKTTTITSNDSNVVEIGVNGKLKAVGEGSAIITITALDGGVSTSCTVTVTHNYFKTVVEPSCSLEGMDVFTCTGCGDNYTGSIVPPLGHSFTNYVSNNDATCTADGTKTAKCDRCDVTDTIADTGSAKGHTIVIDKAVAPACTETGLTEGSHCSVCNTVLVKQEVIPATGHNDSNSDGICDSCGDDLGTHTPSENCTCICHKGGFMGFIYKIIRIFWKFFGTNKACACGQIHY